MEMAYVGIDPGGSGCAALLTNSQGIKLHDWSGMGAARECVSVWSSKFEILKIGIEDPAYLPHRSGAYGIKGLWRNVGQWEGILTGLGLDWVFIPTKTWRQIIPKRGKNKSVKASSVEFAKSLFPKAQSLIYLAKHHDRAEAILIAVYLRASEKMRRRRIQ